MKVYKIYRVQDHRVLPASMKAIVDLMEKVELPDKGYKLHTVNWYSSLALFQYLQTWKTNAVSTVCTNRKGMPLDLRASQEHLYFRSINTGKLCLQWVVKYPVMMLLTAHTSNVITLPRNHKGEK